MAYHLREAFGARPEGRIDNDWRRMDQTTQHLAQASAAYPLALSHALGHTWAHALDPLMRHPLWVDSDGVRDVALARLRARVCAPPRRLHNDAVDALDVVRRASVDGCGPGRALVCAAFSKATPNRLFGRVRSANAPHKQVLRAHAACVAPPRRGHCAHGGGRGGGLRAQATTHGISGSPLCYSTCSGLMPHPQTAGGALADARPGVGARVGGCRLHPAFLKAWG